MFNKHLDYFVETFTKQSIGIIPKLVPMDPVLSDLMYDAYPAYPPSWHLACRDKSWSGDLPTQHLGGVTTF